MRCIDAFSKSGVIVPIASKSEGDLAASLFECTRKMGWIPELIYSDGEASLNTQAMQKQVKDHEITCIPTKTHSMFAEIMTFTC